MAPLVEDLHAELDRYEKALAAAGLQPRAVQTYVDQARRFVRWLAGDYLPRGGDRTTPNWSETASSRELFRQISVPRALEELVGRWRAAERPTQPGIDWPRQRWIATFPQHAQPLRALPDRLDRLDRLTLRRIGAAAAADAASAEVAFIAVMAWGCGAIGYGLFRTRRILAATPDARDRLHRVVSTLAASGAAAAYRRLAVDADCHLRYLGPAFATKYLYFCQPEGHAPQALIHDRYVSVWLSRNAGLELHSSTWSERT